jgi:hypothetical protein
MEEDSSSLAGKALGTLVEGCKQVDDQSIEEPF